MSNQNIINPLTIPEVQAYYEDIYRFKINNEFTELKFSKSKINYERLCKRLANITIPDPVLLPYQPISLEELKNYIKDILNKLFDNAYKNQIDTLLESIILDKIENPFDAILEENYHYDKLVGQKIHISNKLSSIQIVAASHEITHALLSKYYGPSYNPHLNNIHYKELLSIIVEYIVCYELSKTIQDDLTTKQKINRLFLNQNNIQEHLEMQKVLKMLKIPSYKIYGEYVEHTGYGNIISDMYGRRLLELYKDDPNKLLKLLQGIIDGNQQIKDLIKYYHLGLTDKKTIYGYYDSIDEVMKLSKKY